MRSLGRPLMSRMSIPFHFDLLAPEQFVTSNGEHRFPWVRLLLGSTVPDEADILNFSKR